MKKNKRNRLFILLTFCTLVSIFLLSVFFFLTPLNNTLRSFTHGKDTPVDQVVKKEVEKKIEAQANQTTDAQEASNLNQLVPIVKKEPLSTIMDAAKSEQKATQLIEKDTHISKTVAQEKVHQVFTDPKYVDIRAALAKGDYYQAYRAYQKLSEGEKND
ncbi:hypothetical protein PFZ79_002801 [Enterococcus hirae]|nr:hypothetical protein [Enterococcus hirae]